jgi:hypothetical protein
MVVPMMRKVTAYSQKHCPAGYTKRMRAVQGRPLMTENCAT